MPRWFAFNHFDAFAINTTSSTSSDATYKQGPASSTEIYWDVIFFCYCNHLFGGIFPNLKKAY